MKIYRQHLVRPYLIGAINRLRPKDLATFQANRQIYNEAIDVFYIENRFAIFHPPDLKWLQGMGHTNCQQLRNVIVQFPVRVCHRLDEKSIINWLPRKLNILFELLAECEQLSLTLKITVQHLKLLREKGVLRHLKGNVDRVTIAGVPDVCTYHEEFGAHPVPWFQSMRHLAKERCKDLMRQVELDFTMDCWGKEKTGIAVVMVNTHCCLYDSI